MRRATYQIRRALIRDREGEAEDERWYWSLVGANGEVMCSSELYTTKANAKRGAQDAKKSSRFAKVDK